MLCVTLNGELIGEKFMINCALQNVNMDVLFDTGAQVFMISKSMLAEHFPNMKVQDISQLLGSETAIDLKTADGSSLPYEGDVLLTFALNERGLGQIEVPMLVTNSNLECVIIGYNVLEELILNDS